MKVIVKSDAQVGSVKVKKGENEVAEFVANALRAAGLLIEKKSVAKKVEKAVKEAVKKVAPKAKKTKKTKKKTKK